MYIYIRIYIYCIYIFFLYIILQLTIYSALLINPMVKDSYGEMVYHEL